MLDSHSICVGQSRLHKVTNENHGTQTEYVLSYINHGRLEMCQQSVFEVQANMFTLIPAGMPHQIISGDELEVWWLSFCPSCLGLHDNSVFMQAFRQVRLGALPIVKANPNRHEFINTLFNELVDATTLHSSRQLDVQKSLLILLLNEANQAKTIATQTQQQSEKVMHALDFIQRHFQQPISLKDVAKAVHTSPSHLATLVKNETGYSIGEWITRNRLTEACSRLLHTNSSVNTIVETLGWQDTTHFIRQFKKAFGITPAAWRRQQKQNL